jgi:hypothetical protein
MDAGTSGAGDYAGGGDDSEGIGEVLGGGGDSEDGGGGDENFSDVYVDAESRNSREGIVLALAEMGKHLQSMMAAQGACLQRPKISKNAFVCASEDALADPRRKRSPEAVGGPLPLAKKRSTNPESRWACTPPFVAMLTPVRSIVT